MPERHDTAGEIGSRAADASAHECRRVRPLTLDEHHHVIEYFHSADEEFLRAMGADRNRLIPKHDWFDMLKAEFAKAPEHKAFCYVGWELAGELVGHSNINNIAFGDWANIHLHLWHQTSRVRGLGTWFFTRSVNFFLDTFKLKMIVCEPYSENPAPNRMLRALGVSFVGSRTTIPGMINFEQVVHRYEITQRFELGERDA